MRLMAVILPAVMACSSAPQKRQYSNLLSIVEPSAHQCIKVDTYYSVGEGNRFQFFNGYMLIVEKITYGDQSKVKVSLLSPTGGLVDSPELENLKTYSYKDHNFRISIGGVRAYPKFGGGSTTVADIEVYYCD